MSRRLGSSFLEVQVAMVVFGIAVAGLCPLVVMQARLMRKIETAPVGSNNPQLIRGVRMLDGSPYTGPGQVAPSPTILQPEPDAWVRRLGVVATFRPGVPGQSYTPLPNQASVDDDSAGFSAPALWATNADPAATNGDDHLLPGGTKGVGPAIWTFPTLVPGRYKVQATWVPDARNATAARYAFAYAAGQTAIVPVDQTAGATGPATWNDLGTYYLPASFQVSLSGGAGDAGRVVADSVQVVPADPANQVTLVAPAITAGDGVGATVRIRAVPR